MLSRFHISTNGFLERYTVVLNNRYMKKFLFVILAFIFTVGVSHAIIDSYVINRDKLPEEAQKMLEEYFPKAKVS